MDNTKKLTSLEARKVTLEKIKQSVVLQKEIIDEQHLQQQEVNTERGLMIDLQIANITKEIDKLKIKE